MLMAYPKLCCFVSCVCHYVLTVTYALFLPQFWYFTYGTKDVLERECKHIERKVKVSNNTNSLWKRLIFHFPWTTVFSPCFAEKKYIVVFVPWWEHNLNHGEHPVFVKPTRSGNLRQFNIGILKCCSWKHGKYQAKALIRLAHMEYHKKKKGNFA